MHLLVFLCVQEPVFDIFATGSQNTYFCDRFPMRDDIVPELGDALVAPGS